MTDKFITFTFYILFFFTPLFFTPLNSELFEFNKMMLVYFLTTIITGAWIIKMLNTKQFLLRKTPIDIPILAFLISQIISTLTSMDPHTSWWGYYSRSNGGLYSVITYILLYYALISNFDFNQALKLLKVGIWGGLAVALYAIPEHFGFSPSCLILSHTFSADCWVQDVQARVFATLGQPNWLAAYLEMLIFPSLYFALTAKSRFQAIFYFLISILFYLAFTFTYSRGATLGLVIGLLTFLSFWLVQNQAKLVFLNRFWSRSKSRPPQNDKLGLKILGLILGSFLIANLLFGSAVTGAFRLWNTQGVTARPTLTDSAPSVGTQLENGGTESGQIRLIVWKGALEVFKHYPIFGSGVETFAYSYYLYRPIEHNMVSEWDFLYNKAHNEYLNYLSTTGIVGFLSYMSMIVTFAWWCLKKLTASKVTNDKLLITSLFCSYVAYLIQNFFGFSVVIITLFFFTFPAFAFLTEAKLSFRTFDKNSYWISIFRSTITSKSLYINITCWVVAVAVVFNLYTLVKYWRADTYYKLAQDYASSSPSRAFNLVTVATQLNSGEPLYHMELGSDAATSAVEKAENEATLSAKLKNKAVFETQTALNMGPQNTSLWRSAILNYYTLALIDPQYEQVTIQTFDKTISLAPTDPKLEYNKGQILDQLQREDEAIAAFNKALQLKPNYDDALFALAEAYQKQNQIEDSIRTYNQILKYFPGETRATTKLQELATVSAKPK